MAGVTDILQKALRLDASERAAVAHELLLSLEPESSDDDADRAWAAEIKRRVQAIRDGRVVLRDWDDALADARRSIAGGKDA